jgi:hypothetical protein
MLIQPRSDSIQQGDIIQDVPFVVLGSEFNIQASETKGQVRLRATDATSFDRVKEHAKGKKLNAVNVPLVLQPGLILTQGCDIEHKDHITVARIFPLQTVSESARVAIDHGERLALHDMIRGLTERYNFPNIVYLGPLDGLGRCCADLMRVQSYPLVWKSCFLQKRWRSLSDEGLKYLQGRLNMFSGRFALDDGFWHMEDDTGIQKQAQDQDAVQRSYQQVEAKQREARIRQGTP